MNKFKHIFGAFAVVALFSCSSTKIGLTENWIDERDMMALVNTPINEWMAIAGRPSLVEIVGDTSIYYYNYKPTLYAFAIYDSTSFFATWGTAQETKPSLANATEVWGSRKDIIQIKLVANQVISAVVSDGPDKKVFVRNLNGDIILEPNSGFNSSLSVEQKIDKNSKDFNNAYNSVSGKYSWISKYNAPVAPVAPIAPVDSSAAAAVVADTIPSAVAEEIPATATPEATLETAPEATSAAPADSTISAP